MGYLGDLASAIGSQYVSTSNVSMTNVINGQSAQYSQLGDFAGQIDQSAQRRYVDEGYLRKDPYNFDLKQFQILLQEPNATVFVKKKQFSSISGNFRPDFMDQDEKLYFRAMRVLLQNKCNIISTLEKLSKIQRVVSATGSVASQLLPIISTLVDSLSGGGAGNLFGGAGGAFSSSGDPSKLSVVMDQVRRIYGFNTTNSLTSWVTDNTALFQSQIGAGTGVIELTNFTGFSTNCSVDGIKEQMGFNLTISDPYQGMLITDWDIEKAIADATNMWYSNAFFTGLSSTNSSMVSTLQTQLNQIREARGASDITFNIDQDNIIGSPVIAIITGSGQEIVFTYNGGFGGIGSSVNVSPDFLMGGSIAGADGLSTGTAVAQSGVRQNTSEVGIFSNIITSIYSQMQLSSNSQSGFQTANKSTNYVRAKLRENFSGQQIIQDMDVIHFYINSKSRQDTRLLSGLQNIFNGNGVLQNLNNSILNTANAISSLLNPSGNINTQIEKAAYVGADFPNYLWTILRSQFVSENEGTHVYAGVVESVSDTWSDGKYITTISGKDNTAYFDQGKINFNPGVDFFNGSIYDPLTPFKTRFDTITSNAKDNTPQLLDENVVILGTAASKGLLRAKAGPFAGQKVVSDSFVQGVLVNSNTSQISREIFAPDGLVYKWKEGISATIQYGNSLEMNDPNKVGQPKISNNPFAGQDIMNVISLLITGQPYNYATFWRATANINGVNTDPHSGQAAITGYMASLQKDLTKNNILWGNFIPFKKLVIDEASFALAMIGQAKIVQKNITLDANLAQLANLKAQSNLIGAGQGDLANNPQLSEGLNSIQSQIAQLQTTISSDISDLQKQTSQFNSQAAASGPDATFDSSATGVSSGSTNSSSPADPAVRKALRKQINFLTRRMSYNVRANEDKNLFIVDDTYDKDYDLQAYDQSLVDGVALYGTNEFLSTRDKITATADLLSLEVFADTQGHIRVRPPQYNRMPSSVFYQMLYLQQARGIQIFPEFLKDMFGNQLDNLKTKIEVLEDLIRLYCAVLGFVSDSAAANFLQNGSSVSSLNEAFSFLTDDSDTLSNIPAVSATANTSVSDVQAFISGIQGQTKAGFSNGQRYSVLLDSLTRNTLSQNGVNTSPDNLSNNSYIQQLITRIQTKSGQKIVLADYITSATGAVNVPTRQQVDVFKVTSDIQTQLLARRQAIKLFASTLKNSAEIRALSPNSGQSGDNPTTLSGGVVDLTVTNPVSPPPAYNNSNIPEVFAHMIEDENYDDLGVGSGKRFVINSDQIQSITINVKPPDYTMVQVNGVINPFGFGAGLQTSFANNGNGLVTAVAVDYSTWRNHGFKDVANLNLPFLSDPDTQCAPYAAMVLSRGRKNILYGSLTISGNEFMQPGEVIFLKDRGLLFYVKSVAHNFSFGGSFKTTLALTYGHTPGDYIPIPTDIIGKMLYNNRDLGGFTIQRQTSSGNETSIGVIINDTSGGTSGLSTDGMSPTPISAFNSKVLNNILYIAAYYVNANGSAGTNINATVQLRIYCDNSNPVNGDLQSFASNAVSVLTGGSSSITNPVSNPTFPSSAVKIVTVNLDDDTVRMSPSQKAMDAARNQASSLPSGGASPGIDVIRQSLFKNVVDCWLSFAPVGSGNAQ
jgi:hypothetical protein